MLDFIKSIFHKRKVEIDKIRLDRVFEKNRQRFDSIHSDKRTNGLNEIYQRLKAKDLSLTDTELLLEYKKFSDSLQTNTFSAAELELVSISILCFHRPHLTEQLLKQSLNAILWSYGDDIDYSILKQFIDKRILPVDIEPYGGLPDREGIEWLSNIVVHQTDLIKKVLSEVKEQNNNEIAEVNYNFDIIWKGQKVGRIENCIPDMWYLEGMWVSDKSSLSNDFEKLVLTFAAKEVMQDPTNGTRAILKDDDNKKETHALVHSMADGTLFLRRVFDDDAVKWLLKNVK
jgi:hypothetical protein